MASDWLAPLPNGPSNRSAGDPSLATNIPMDDLTSSSNTGSSTSPTASTRNSAHSLSPRNNRPQVPPKSGPATASSSSSATIIPITFSRNGEREGNGDAIVDIHDSENREAPLDVDSDADSEPPNLQHEHDELHKESSLMHDMIIGFSDGLTVPFSLTAGLSSLGSSKLVVIGGLAELFSGAISMGLGGFLAVETERAHYDAEWKREAKEVVDDPLVERKECIDLLRDYGVRRKVVRAYVEELMKTDHGWIQFMMDLEVKLQRPKPGASWKSGAVLGGFYLVGGIFPLIPYIAMPHNATHALFVSIGVTVVILLAFGFIKQAYFVNNKAGPWGALQTLCIGGLAAGASYGIVRGINSAYGVNVG